MLTKNDLRQIKNIFKTELSDAIEHDVRPLVREEARSIVKEELEPVKKDIKLIKRKLNTVSDDLHYVIGKFDTRIAENTNDIKKIKLHVGLAQ